MRALVLAAGFGTRLGSLTASTPKPMLRIDGRPILEYILRHLRSSGITHAAINLHFMPEAIRSYFGDGSGLGMALHYSYEPVALGTAGALQPVEEFLRQDGDFIVQYGDVLTDQDLSALAEFHRERDSLTTLLVHQRAGSNSVVSMDASGHVTGFLERPTAEQRRSVSSTWVNSGLCMCRSEIIELVPRKTPSDLPRDVFPRILETGRLFAAPLTGYRCAIDSPDRLREAVDAVREGRCRIDLSD